MEKILSVGEYDLLNFFEMIPSHLDPGVAWTYNDSVYEAADAHVHLSFAIAPVVRDVRVVLKVGDAPVYEVDAMGIKDVKYHNDKGRESLDVILSDRDSIWLRIKPIPILHLAVGMLRLVVHVSMAGSYSSTELLGVSLAVKPPIT